MLDLVEILNSEYPKENITKPVLNRVSPTRIIGCPRGGFFSAFGFREPLSARSEQNFSFGTKAHERIQEILDRKGIAVEVEKKFFYNDPPMMGFVDAIIKDGYQKYVLEIKTTSKKIESLHEPMQTHIDQIMLYLHVTGIKKGIILYETKFPKHDTFWKFFSVDYDADKARKVLHRGRRLMEDIKEFKIPLPEKGCMCSNPACYDKTLQRKAKTIWKESQ